MTTQVKIAICGPFSGPRAAYGDMLKSLANKYLGHISALYIEFFDDCALPDTALAVAQQIISKNFDLVIGHFNSQCSLAVAPLYQSVKTPFIAPLSTNQDLKLTKGGAIFCPSDADQIDTLRQVAGAPDINNIFIIHDGSKYSRNFISLAKLRFENVVLVDCHERFTPTANDLVFLAGAHCNLIAPHLMLRTQSSDITIVACDDCFIDEYFDAVKHRINDNDFVVGQLDGHEGNLQQAFEYVTLLLRQTNTQNAREQMFNKVGMPLHNFEFNDCGRLTTSSWQRLPIKQLMANTNSIKI